MLQLKRILAPIAILYFFQVGECLDCFTCTNVTAVSNDCKATKTCKAGEICSNITSSPTSGIARESGSIVGRASSSTSSTPVCSECCQDHNCNRQLCQHSCVRYKVVLNVYSGRENPDWEIDEKNPLYDRISQLVNEGPPTPLNDNLGYAGFVVEATNAMGQKTYTTIGRHTNRKLESILLRSCPSTVGLSQQVISHVYSGIIGKYRKKVLPVSPIAKIVRQPVARVSITTSKEDDNSHIYIKHRLYRKKRRSSICSTQFQPEIWNNTEVQRQNNGYNYATNIQTNTLAQPGRKSGQIYTNITAKAVYAAAVRDGLTRLSGRNAGTECLIALFIWPGQDYLFLRLDNNRHWSLKNGRNAARNVDYSGDLITDPQTADLGLYTVFAGWLGVGPNARIS